MSVKIEGTHSLEIGASREVIISQFQDLEHHNTHKVHPGLQWEVLEDNDTERLIRMGAKTGRLYWQDGDLVLCVVSGQGKGTTIHHRFIELSKDRTKVEMSFEWTLPVFLSVLAPLIRWKIMSDIEKGLHQDKKDIEEFGYPRPD